MCYSTCPDGTYNNATSGTCPACYYTCLKCSTYSVCTDCDPASNRYLSNSSCIPNSGFIDQGVFIAVDCSTLITHCLDCSSVNATVLCNSCDAGFAPSSDSKTCTSTASCLDPNCLDCSGSISICITCTTGYSVVSSVCNTICGDGLKLGN